MTHPSCSRADSGCPSTCYTADDARGCDRLRPQVFGVRIAETVVIDRLRTSLQARIGSTRDRKDQDPDTKPEALPEKELRADLIASSATPCQAPASCPDSRRQHQHLAHRHREWRDIRKSPRRPRGRQSPGW